MNLALIAEIPNSPLCNGVKNQDSAKSTIVVALVGDNRQRGSANN
ncbi:hypothetical protein SRDD_39830 [Serratia sp. DD3]|nr:hypothetical protein SRDD_39830 [Serratia sp. DD3]